MDEASALDFCAYIGIQSQKSIVLALYMRSAKFVLSYIKEKSLNGETDGTI